MPGLRADLAAAGALPRDTARLGGPEPAGDDPIREVRAALASEPAEGPLRERGRRSEPVSTLADQVGACAVALKPLHDLIAAHVLRWRRNVCTVTTRLLAPPANGGRWRFWASFATVLRGRIALRDRRLRSPPGSRCERLRLEETGTYSPSCLIRACAGSLFVNTEIVTHGSAPTVFIMCRPLPSSRTRWRQLKQREPIQAETEATHCRRAGAYVSSQPCRAPTTPS